MMSFRERCAFHEAAHATAALILSIPIVSVSLNPPNMHRGHYRAPHDCGLEYLVTICLSGPIGEELICGTITDGSDQADYEMAKGYLSRAIADPLRVGIELARCRVAAERLVSSKFAQDRIAKLAAALLARGTLSGEEIHGL